MSSELFFHSRDTQSMNSSMSLTDNFNELKDMMEKYADGQPHPLVFLVSDNGYEPNNEQYSETDRQHLSHQERDFKARLYISNFRVGDENTFLRNYHSDIAPHTSYLCFIGDLYKAYYRGNHNMARKILMQLMKVCFHLKKSDYNSLGVTIASGMSNHGQNISFQRCKDLIQNSNVFAARKRLTLLMDTVFPNLAAREFFIYKSGTNIYRVAYVSRSSRARFLAIFTFLLQLSLTFYATLDVIEEFPGISWLSNSVYMLLPLAVMSSLYSASIVLSELANLKKIRYFYGWRFSILFFADLFVTLFIPLILLVVGFFLILTKKKYIEGVINTAALLFVLNIDESISLLFSEHGHESIESYLLEKCVEEYDKLTEMSDKEIDEKVAKIDKIDFCDYYLTNLPEGGSDERLFRLFLPYELNVRSHDNYYMKPCEVITINCLFGRIEWKYSNEVQNTTTPYISSLKLTKLNQPRQVIEIPYKSFDADDSEMSNQSSKTHSLNGIFLITRFRSTSNHVTKLRVCGTTISGAHFVKAIDYYSLWSMNQDARRFLKKYQIPMRTTGIQYFDLSVK